jgi:hypothetical protein
MMVDFVGFGCTCFYLRCGVFERDEKFGCSILSVLFMAEFIHFVERLPH